MKRFAICLLLLGGCGSPSTAVSPLPFQTTKFVKAPRDIETLSKEIVNSPNDFQPGFTFIPSTMLSNDMPGTMHNFWLHFETDSVRSPAECMPSVRTAIKRAVHTKYCDMVRVYFSCPGESIPYLQIDWESPDSKANYSAYQFKVEDRRALNK